jgi:uncharacterized membrane protein
MRPDRRGTGAELGPAVATRLVVAAVLGAGCGAVAGVAAGWRVAVLTGWAVAAAAYVGWMWVTIARMDGPATAAHAAREDPGRRAAHLIVIGSAVASLAAVALLLARGATSGPRAVEQAALSVLSVALAWAAVHTAFTTRYAHLYYTRAERQIDFGDVDQPAYSDFAYLAFTIGMTFQVSDTQLRSTAMRAAVLQHALVSYVLGVVVIAATVNLLVGLGG